MKTLTKKLLIVFTALLVASVLVFGAACELLKTSTDEYKEIAEADREQFVADTIVKLMVFDATAMGKYQMKYRIYGEEIEDGVKETSDIRLEITVDGSKSQTVIHSTETIGEQSDVVEATVWADSETAEIFYKLKVNDGETKTGKYTNEETNMTVRDVVAYADMVNSLPMMLLGIVAEALEEETAKIYTLDDEIKIVVNGEHNTFDSAETLEVHLTFVGENSINCKLDMNSKFNETDFGIMQIEIAPSTATVTMPDYE